MSNTPPPSAPAPGQYPGNQGAPAGQYGYAPAPQDKWNVMAIVSFIASFFINIVGVILGFIALSQIKKTGEKGKGLAIAGIIIGFVSIVISIIAIIAFFAILSTASQYEYTY